MSEEEVTSTSKRRLGVLAALLVVVGGVLIVALLLSPQSADEASPGAAATAPETADSGWIQAGMDVEVDGRIRLDIGATVLAISGDGATVAIRHLSSNDDLPDGRNVDVFRWRDSDWEPLGATVTNDGAGGVSVALSADGNTMVLGDPNGGNAEDARPTVRVLRWNGDSWGRLGDELGLPSNETTFGRVVAISDDGNTVAFSEFQLGPTERTERQVFSHRWDGRAWNPLGSDIVIEDANSNIQSIALSGDGSTLVAVTGRRVAHIYRWSGAAWVQLGEPLSRDRFRSGWVFSGALSEDGETVLLSGLRSSTQGPGGIVAVFRWENETWTQVGESLEGGSFTSFGASADISADGNTVAASSYVTEGEDTYGLVEVFTFDGTSWTQIGERIPAQDIFLAHIALSDSAGRIVISGRIETDPTDGRLRAFDFR